jgi:hypothetical protein
MKQTDNGSAPGPSGYGSNYIAVLAHDPQCVEALAYILQQIINNSLPDAIRRVLTTCVLVSLKKSKGGRRPIAIGDIFYRMAAKYTLRLIIKKGQRKMEPYQYGVGQKDGCTQIVQSLQYLLNDVCVPATDRPPDECITSLENQTAAHAISRPMVCLSIDIQNAFNSIDRAAVLNAVYSDPELAQCWKLVSFAYGSPSLLLMNCNDSIPNDEAFVSSETGVRQGDPLAAFLFSLAMHKVYDAIAKKSRGVYAFIDDANAVGTMEECWSVWRSLRQLLSPLGLTVNLSKCELSCFQMDKIQHHQADLAAYHNFKTEGIQINTQTFKLLGCVIGVDDATIATALEEHQFSAERKAALRRLPLMKKQTAMLVLQQLNGTVITNRLRAMSPASTEKHATAYDTAVLSCARTIIGIPDCIGDKHDQQLQQPAGSGGFGLLSAVNIAPAAYLAGAENTLRHSPAFRDMWNNGVVLPSTSTIHHGIDDSLTIVKTREQKLIDIIAQLRDPIEDLLPINSVLPESADSFIAHYKARQDPGLIQSRLTQRHSTLISMAQVMQVKGPGQENDEQLARLQSLLLPDASLWLTTHPTHPRLKLTDNQWQWAAWLRLAMQVPTDVQGCTSCGDKTAYINNAWHALSCSPLSGRAFTDRHNEVLNRIGEFCRLIYLYPHLEPRGLDSGSERRPDLQVTLPEKTVLSDITIIHPACKTWREVVTKVDIIAAGNQKEAEKDKKYQSIAKALDMEFNACVLYTYGGFHASALRLIKKLTAAVDPATSLISPADFKAQLKKQIAIAVQRGNADIMMQANQRHRDQVLRTASYRHAPKRHRQTYHNTQLSASTLAANTAEVNRTEEQDVNTSTITEETQMIVDSLPTTVSSTTETCTQGVVASRKMDSLPSATSLKAGLDGLIRQLCQDMDKDQTYRGERRRVDIDTEEEELAEMGCVGAGDPETRERVMEEVDSIMLP